MTERRAKENMKNEHEGYLLLIFIPPRTGFGDCLLPSANEVVLGLPPPLISSAWLSVLGSVAADLLYFRSDCKLELPLGAYNDGVSIWAERDAMRSICISPVTLSMLPHCRSHAHRHSRSYTLVTKYTHTDTLNHTLSLSLATRILATVVSILFFAFLCASCRLYSGEA